jgi:DNA topoisomerase-1
VIDLPSKKFGIDVENNFTPEYEILSGKEEVIKKLKSAAKEVDMVYLSPDPDREGEAIAWHIASVLPKNTKFKRVTFNEFTKDAVYEALQESRDINLALVNAQQARRLLDRMVGYKISPLLHKKIPRKGQTGSLSAGRVQSVALKLVVDRERAIDAFNPVEYWNLGSFLRQKKGANKFEATLHMVDGLKVEKEAVPGKKVCLIPNEKKALEIKSKLDKRSSEKREKKTACSTFYNFNPPARSCKALRFFCF